MQLSTEGQQERPHAGKSSSSFTCSSGHTCSWAHFCRGRSSPKLSQKEAACRASLPPFAPAQGSPAITQLHVTNTPGALDLTITGLCYGYALSSAPSPPPQAGWFSLQVEGPAVREGPALSPEAAAPQGVNMAHKHTAGGPAHNTVSPASHSHVSQDAEYFTEYIFAGRQCLSQLWMCN